MENRNILFGVLIIVSLIKGKRIIVFVQLLNHMLMSKLTHINHIAINFITWLKNVGQLFRSDVMNVEEFKHFLNPNCASAAGSDCEHQRKNLLWNFVFLL